MKSLLVVFLGLQLAYFGTSFAASESEPFFSNETLGKVSEVEVTDVATEAAGGVIAKKEDAKLPENEIPLHLTEKKTAANSESGLGRLVISMAVLMIAGFGIYLYMKRIAKPKNSKNQQIKVLAQHYLGPKKNLAIIRVAGESILIGVTDHNINMIKSLSLLDEEIPEFSEKDFSSALEQTNKRMQSDRKDMDLDDFSMKGIRDIVSKKLANMRTLE